MKTWRLALLAVLVSSSCNAFADELEFIDSDEDELGGFYGDEEFINIATGTSKPISKAPAVASVITSEDIRRMGAASLDEILERVPGLHVSLSKVNRFDSIYSIRGIQTGRTPQILVLLNGLEFKNSFTGALPFTFRLPAKAIERIEVLRGPGSAVYGADSFSGVINIVTKSDIGDTKGTVSLRAASFDTQELWFETGYKQDDLSVHVQGSKSESDGDLDRIVPADAQTNFDNIFGTNASNAPGPVNTDYDITNFITTVAYQNFSFEHWYWQQDKGGVGPGAGQSLDPTGYQNHQLNRFRLAYQYDFNEDFNVKADVSLLHQSQHTWFSIFPAGAKVRIGTDGNINFGPGSRVVDFPNGVIGAPSSDHDDIRVNLVANYHASEHHNLRFSAGWFEQELQAQESKNFGPGILDSATAMVPDGIVDITGTPYVYHPDVSRTVRYMSVQDEWRIASDWELTLGLRLDEYSDFGSTVNPRVALVWDTDHNLTTKFLYGSAFRAPSFTEQFLQNNPVNLGNPDLQPEEIDTYEVAFDYRPSFGTQIILSLFHYQATGMIDLVSEGPGVSRNQNVNDQRGKGFEIVGRYDITTNAKLEANYAYQDSENDLTGQKIADAPGQQLFLGIDYTFSDNWSFTSQLYWIGDRKRPTNDNRPEMDDYTNVNATLLYKSVESNWSARLAIRNLLDSDQREPSTGAMPDDYPLEGRRVGIEVEYSF